MTFDAIESSIDQGRPVWLYDFDNAPMHWRYTSADADVLWNTYTWEHRTIAHDHIANTSETSRNDLTLKVAETLEFVQQYRVVGPSTPVLLTVRKYHYGDANAVVEWYGRVSSVGWPGQYCVIVAQPATAGLQQTGLRRRVSINCEYPLYSIGEGRCNLLRSTVSVPATITAITTNTVSAAEVGTHPDGYFVGGYIAWLSADGVQQRRFVLGHVGTVLTLLSGSYDLSVGLGVVAQPGCAHTVAACKAFGNLPNYGGLPYLPIRSPFDGSPVY